MGWSYFFFFFCFLFLFVTVFPSYGPLRIIFYFLLHNFYIIWCVIGVILHTAHYVSRFFATILNPRLVTFLLLRFHNVFIKKKNCSSTYVCLLRTLIYIYIVYIYIGSESLRVTE